MLPNNIELGGLIAKPRLQRANPKPDAFMGEPGLENRHRSAFAAREARGRADLRLARMPIETRLRPVGFGAASFAIWQAAILRSAAREAGWWGKKDSNLRSHKTADLQSAPFATRDTPPLRPHRNPPAEMAAARLPMTLIPGADGGLPVGRFMAEGRWQSQPTPPANPRPQDPQIAIIRNP
jgi:hypothetical protein